MVRAYPLLLAGTGVAAGRSITDRGRQVARKPELSRSAVPPVTPMGAKLARLVYRMLKYGQE